MSTPSSAPTRRFWWVNQRYTYEVERDGALLWAPKLTESGRSHPHWKALTQVAPGDLIFNYRNPKIAALSMATTAALDSHSPDGLANQRWRGEGRLIRAKYEELDQSLPVRDIPHALRVEAWPQSPFTRNGTVKQGYLFPVDPGLAAQLIEQLTNAGRELSLIHEHPADASIPDAVDEDPYIGPLSREGNRPSRGEQRELRSRLLGGTQDAECALCGRILPAHLLRAAHIKPRASCSEEEKRDISHVAFLACTLGCDHLFELGYLAVSEGGTVITAELSHYRALREHLAPMGGRRCPFHTADSSRYFQWHRLNVYSNSMS